MNSDVSIAIIDDHELVREGLSTLIASSQAPLGRIVYCGENPVDAAAASPVVALLDVDLGPGSARLADSVALLCEGGANVLLISAFEDAVAVRAAMDAGALGFVPKRASVEVLRGALSTVAVGELYLSVDLAAILASAADTPELSPRELDVLRLYASGLKLTAVANQLGISPHTAKEYLDRVRGKYAQVGRTARTRTELYAAANRDGLLESDR